MTRAIVAVCILSLVLSAAATARADEEAIVALVYEGEIRCSGALIAPDRVLTAAHCAAPQSPGRVRVQTRSGARDVAVRWARVSPRYRALDLFDDVAVLAIDDVHGVTPLELTSGEDDDAPAVVVGFGAEAGAPNLRAAKPVRVRRDLDGSLLLTPGPLLPCGGDSGAPVIDAHGRAFGVVSRGDARCRVRAHASAVVRQEISALARDRSRAALVLPLVALAAGAQLCRRCAQRRAGLRGPRDRAVAA